MGLQRVGHDWATFSFCPHRVQSGLCPGRCFKTECILFASSLGVFKLLFLCWCPERVSLSSSPLKYPSSLQSFGSPGCEPHCFHSQMFWRLISLFRVLRVGVPDMGHAPLPTEGKALDLWNPSQLQAAMLGWGSWWGCLCSLLWSGLFYCLPFYCFAGRIFSFYFFPQRELFHM